jgi:multiple antibiotic resistance protein
MILLKILHNFISSRKEKLIERYIEITGRITALIVGTFSIEMILQGLMAWLKVL